MKIGLDLDGTVYEYPEFFRELINALAPLGHRFYCISSHARWEWDERDVPRLRALGFATEFIDPSLMYEERHGELAIKGRAASQCDIVFDDDVRLREYTRTGVISPLKKRKV